MKQIIAVPLALLILFTGINVKIASHYCGGNFSAVKVSLTGQMASCGMEDQSEAKPCEDLFSTHCCDDVISSVSISPNYVLSSFSYIPVAGQEINNTFITQDQLVNIQTITISSISGIKKPPGEFSSSAVEQHVICIFQI